MYMQLSDKLIFFNLAHGIIVKVEIKQRQMSVWVKTKTV